MKPKTIKMLKFFRLYFSHSFEKTATQTVFAICLCSFLYLLSGLLTIQSYQLQAQSDIIIDKVVGIVGDEIVLLSDIEVQTAQAKAQGVTEDNIECQVLDQMLLEKLLINQAELDSIVISEEEVEIELDNRLRYYVAQVGSEEKFEEYYQKSILEFKDEFRPDVQKMMLAQRMQGEIVGGVQVTPMEVQEFFNVIPKDSLPYFNAEVEVGEIVVKPQVSEKVKTETKDKLRNLRERIVNGDNTFEELAKSYSADPGSARNGGSLGFQDRGTFVKEFEAAAFKLTKGELSGIVETEYGYHLLKLLERRGNKVHIQHILLKPEFTADDLETSQVYADSVRNLIVMDSVTFKQAVEDFSQDENSQKMNGMLVNPNTGTNYFELDQLEPDVFFAVESLKVGELSEPTLIKSIDGSKVYKVFYILSRSEPHQANLDDDYERIKSFAQQQKQNESVVKWIESKSKQTYIHLSDEYKKCETMVKWMNQ